MMSFRKIRSSQVFADGFCQKNPLLLLFVAFIEFFNFPKKDKEKRKSVLFYFLST